MISMRTLVLLILAITLGLILIGAIITFKNATLG